jgi:hypothetical protein
MSRCPFVRIELDERAFWEFEATISTFAWEFRGDDPLVWDMFLCQFL